MNNMKKKLFFAALALVAMAGCTSDENVTVVSPPEPTPETTSDAIVFNSVSKGATRADHVGADAAKMLDNKFIVGGFKNGGPVTATDIATGTAFDNYIVNWKENSAATTESNTSDWEYVGIKAEAPSGIAGNFQTIKYWDYNYDQYDFIAYSTSDATITTTGSAAAAIADGKVVVTPITPATATSSAYQFGGSTDALAKCYIADMVTVYKDGTDGRKYGEEVQLTFRNLASKVRMAIYETVPGYSIKDVKFYTDATTTLATGASTTDATLFTTGTATKDNFYTGGVYTVKFPTIGKDNVDKSDYNKAHVSFSANTKETTMPLGSLNLVGRDKSEEDATNYIGRTSATASFAGTSPYYKTVLPNEEGTVLELRVDYTLLAIDGGGEEIKIHGATAFVPAIYAAWKPNYAYTYIFKISDNTNGWTSTVESDPTGLYPITFDAVVVDSEEFTQSTITSVATPSITTYQLGHNYADNEYKAGDIYVQVMQDGELKNDLNTIKTKLYKVTDRADMTITEADVMDALNIQASTSGNDITGRNGWELKRASITVDGVTAIPGVDGNDITVAEGTAVKFAATAGTYAFVYDYTGGVPAATYYYSAEKLVGQTRPDDWTTAGVWYTDPDGLNAVSDGTNTATYEEGIYYKKYTNLNHTIAAKVIIVQ